jgi:predicted DNA-binding transcriptional regulator YafY
LGLLGDGQVWSGRSLTERSGLSLRTVRRAIAALRDQGVVIDTDVGRGGGVRLGSRSALPQLRLAHPEALALLFALALAESLQLPLLGAGLRGLRTKLSTTFVSSQRAVIHRLRTRMLIGEPASEPVRSSWRQPEARQAELLQQAFIASRTIEFRYVSRDRRVSRRCVEPHYLLLNHPAWYLLGLDRDVRAGRTFRLDGMRDVEVTDEGFKLLSPESLSPGVHEWFHAL